MNPVLRNVKVPYSSRFYLKLMPLRNFSRKLTSFPCRRSGFGIVFFAVTFRTPYLEKYTTAVLRLALLTSNLYVFVFLRQLDFDVSHTTHSYIPSIIQ